MPKEQKPQDQARTKPMANESFGPSLSEAVAAQQTQQQKKNKTSVNGSKKTKWNPFPVEIQTKSSPTAITSSNQKQGRNRRRRKNKAINCARSRKPSSPSLVSTCSSNSVSSGIGSLGSSALNGVHDAISTPTLPSSGCSSIGFSDDKYEDTRFSDLISERGSEIGAEEESGSETLNDAELSVGFITENFVKPDLSHPIVQQFYQEQRIIYRQFYERQFSTIACIPYSDADATYCALSSQFNRCNNIQPHNRLKPPKYSNKNGQHRKGRSNRVFYNSSTRPENHKSERRDSKSSTTTKSDEIIESTTTEKEEEASFSETEKRVENVEHCGDDLNDNQSIAMKDPPKNKDNYRKKDEYSNYNDYNRSMNKSNYSSGGKKRYDQRNPNRSNHQHSQHQQSKEKKTEIEIQKLIERLDPLSAQIYDLQKLNEQTTTSLCEKLYLRDLLYCTIAPHFSGCGLYIVGSTLNGFGSGASDMDLCLMITPRELDQRIDAVLVLNNVMNHLNSMPLVKDMKLIFAKVPILRATFHHPFDKIIVDLNANNAVAIRNTHLLCYYSGFDWRVRPLVCAIKEWAKRRGINNANQSSLTSYSLVLMTIHFLQCGVKPAILPSLQNYYASRFDHNLDVRDLDISYPLEKIHNWDYGKNKMPLSELLKGFFRYYARDFNFDTSAISVRLGKVVDRSYVVNQYKNHHHHGSLSQWRCICIEEPFLHSNTAHSVYDERIFENIKESFEIACTELENSTDLNSLLNTESIQGVNNQPSSDTLTHSPSATLTMK